MVGSNGGGVVAAKQLVDKLSILVEEKHRSARVMECLIAPGEKRARLDSCLAIEAILEYLGREEDQR